MTASASRRTGWETGWETCPTGRSFCQHFDPHVPKLHLLRVRLQTHVPGLRFRLQLLVRGLVEHERVRAIEIHADLRTDTLDLDRVPLRGRLVRRLRRIDVPGERRGRSLAL